MLIDVEIQQASDRLEPLILVVQVIRKLAVSLVVPRAHRVLQLTDSRRIPLVEFTVAAPVKVTTGIQRKVAHDLVAERQLMLLKKFTLDLVQADSIQIRAGSG